MKTQSTLLFLALAVLLAACAPAPGDPTNACAAVLCPTGSTCEDGVCYPSDATRCDDPRPEICTLEYAPVCGSDGQTYGNGCGACGNADVAWHVPGECNAPSADYVACEDPRPEACTREYNPVCATVDNGIRCVTQPCDSTDRKTYATDCTACADPLVYGYEPGACDPEVDNNPADDAPALEAKAYFICKTADYDRTQMAAELDLECVESCAIGFDQYGGQIGLWCIPHTEQADLTAFAQCSRGDQCLPTERCAQASHATDGAEVSWASEAESFRCVPEYYASYLLQTGGLTAIDENGEKTTAIA